MRSAKVNRGGRFGRRALATMCASLDRTGYISECKLTGAARKRIESQRQRIVRLVARKLSAWVWLAVSGKRLCAARETQAGLHAFRPHTHKCSARDVGPLQPRQP